MGKWLGLEKAQARSERTEGDVRRRGLLHEKLGKRHSFARWRRACNFLRLSKLSMAYGYLSSTSIYQRLKEFMRHSAAQDKKALPRGEVLATTSRSRPPQTVRRT